MIKITPIATKKHHMTCHKVIVTLYYLAYTYLYEDYQNTKHNMLAVD